MNEKFVEKSYMTKSTKTNPEKREITQLVPVFDWGKFKSLPNAHEFVEKLFGQCITKMMREIDDNKNGTRPEHMASMESVIAREIGYSESAIRRWCESRDWASADINPQRAANITKHLVEFAPRKRGVQAEHSLAPEVMEKLARRVTQVADKDDPVVEWLFTRLTSSKKEELHLMI